MIGGETCCDTISVMTPNEAVMNGLMKKLKTDRGATLIIALLFFMVCVMVASVIMTAAVANMGRIDKQRDEEQAYLAAFSAARLLQDDFSGMTACTAMKTDVEYTCNYPEHVDTEGVWACEDQDGNPVGSSDALLADYVNNAVLYVLKYDQVPDTKTFTITPDLPQLSSVPVNVRMTLSKDFIMKFVVCATTAKGSSYTMTLSIAGNATSGSSVDNSDYCHHQEQSTTPVLENGEWVYPIVDHAYVIHKTTYTTTITWAPGTISKGE